MHQNECGPSGETEPVLQKALQDRYGASPRKKLVHHHGNGNMRSARDSSLGGGGCFLRRRTGNFAYM
jgi:hypothetical protein